MNKGNTNLLNLKQLVCIMQWHQVQRKILRPSTQWETVVRVVMLKLSQNPLPELVPQVKRRLEMPKVATPQVGKEVVDQAATHTAES